MATLPVLNAEGKKVGDYEIESTDIAPRISKQLLHDVVVMYQANLRQGTFRTRSRAEVRGSTKKLYRQKGTGHARAGDKKSGTRRGGGHIMSKRPRDFYYRLPKKAVRLATRMAVASKLESGSVVVIDELNFDAPKTSAMAAVLKAVGLSGASALVTTESLNHNVYKSTRNIPRVDVLPVMDLNALSILKPQKLLVTKGALDALKAKAAGETSDNGAEAEA